MGLKVVARRRTRSASPARRPVRPVTRSASPSVRGWGNNYVLVDTMGNTYLGRRVRTPPRTPRPNTYTNRGRRITRNVYF